MPPDLKKLKNKIYNLINSYEMDTYRVIMLSSLIIIIAVALTGGISYSITKEAVVHKVKVNDLKFIAQSISSKIEGRIERAKETSLVLANDPLIIRWIEKRETDAVLGEMTKEKIASIAEDYDYNNSFIVSALTGHYWAENGVLIDTMSKADTDDSWFFDVLDSKKSVSMVIDYNNQRHDTFVFINAIMGNLNKPIAVAGIGLNLKDITKEFEGYKFGKKSNMWLIDKDGKIYISEDSEHTGRNISEFMPEKVAHDIVSIAKNTNINGDVIEYPASNGDTYDLVYKPIKSTDWKLIFQIPRSESLSILSSIKINTIVASIITTLLIMIMFYFIINKIANPYKKALLVNQALELKVNERTQELEEKNKNIMDSIEYAKLIQESILPSDNELAKVFKEHFIIWKPKDVVGGDFYWLKRLSGGYIVALVDCTGHGVPGAFMTMAVNSMLNHIVDEKCFENPSQIIKELNKLIKETLHKKSMNEDWKAGKTEDGLDIGIIYIADDRKLVFSGAKLSIYIKGANDLNLLKGNNKGVGYINTDNDYEFTNHYHKVEAEDVFYMTTDGYIDQNGGDKDYSFGKKQFEKLINDNWQENLYIQGELFEKALKEYMGHNPQRDDIAVIGFKF